MWDLSMGSHWIPKFKSRLSRVRGSYFSSVRIRKAFSQFGVKEILLYASINGF